MILEWLKYNYRNFKATYWFIPSMLCTSLLIVLAGLLYFDTITNLNYYTRPDLVREYLIVVAGSTIGVAGTVFSITIAAVSFTASQYGPRILNNFMEDTGNQITIGIFISTFLYCISVLQTMHGSLADVVPQFPIFFLYPLVLVNIAALTYFIHHIPSSLRVSKIIHGIGSELVEKVGAAFYERVSYRKFEDVDEEDIIDETDEESEFILNEDDGYIQSADAGKIFDVCKRHGLVYKFKGRPGDFKSSGMALGVIKPKSKLTPMVEREIREAYSFTVHRNQVRDTLFYLDELIEIAARALSPGINDPYTAMNCMDWIGSFLLHALESEMPTPYYYDSDRNIRVITYKFTYEKLISRACEGLRPYVVGDRKTVIHLLEIIQMIGEQLEDEEQINVLRRQVKNLHAEAKSQSTFDVDLDFLEKQQQKTLRILSKNG